LAIDCNTDVRRRLFRAKRENSNRQKITLKTEKKSKKSPGYFYTFASHLTVAKKE
jgi:hypothetical protein